MAKCGKSKTDPHTCSNLHRLLAKSGKLLDVKISTLPLWIRYSRKRPQQALVKYPVLRMTAWVDCIFRHGWHFFLGGQSMDNAEAFGGQLYNFLGKLPSSWPWLCVFPWIPKSWMESLNTDCHPWWWRAGQSEEPCDGCHCSNSFTNQWKENKHARVSHLRLIRFYFFIGKLLCTLKERLHDPQALLLPEAIDVHAFALHGATFSIHQGQLPAATSVADWRSEVIAGAWIYCFSTDFLSTSSHSLIEKEGFVWIFFS